MGKRRREVNYLDVFDAESVVNVVGCESCAVRVGHEFLGFLDNVA